MNLKIFGKDGKTSIRNIADWEIYGEPAEKKHWKKGRSAQEIARSWLPNNRPGVPKEFYSILNDLFTENIVLEKAIVEKKTKFKDTHRGPRNHDLLIHANLGKSKVIIGIEGKEREPFEKELSQKFKDAKSDNSKLPNRIREFCKGILGLDYDQNKGVLSALYYQFLSGIAGVAVEVKSNNADFGLFIVQQIKNEDTPPSALELNNRSFSDFLIALSGSSISTEHLIDSGIWGPFELPGSQLVPKSKIYIGKFTTYSPLV